MNLAEPVPALTADNVIDVCHLALRHLYLTQFLLSQKRLKFAIIPLEGWSDDWLVVRVQVVLSGLTPILDKPIILNLDDFPAGVVDQPHARQCRQFNGIELDLPMGR